MGQCVPVYLICISLINPQGWYLQFRWDVNSIIFIPAYCYSWHYNKVWGINLTFPKLPNYKPLYKNPVTATALLETNPSSQSLSEPPKTNENHLYIVRYIYFFTITNLELRTIRDLIACVASVSSRVIARKIEREQKNKWKGEGEVTRRNACPQTPRFWKTPLDISRFGSFVNWQLVKIDNE